MLCRGGGGGSLHIYVWGQQNEKGWLDKNKSMFYQKPTKNKLMILATPRISCLHAKLFMLYTSMSFDQFRSSLQKIQSGGLHSPTPTPHSCSCYFDIKPLKHCSVLFFSPSERDRRLLVFFFIVIFFLVINCKFIIKRI